MNKSMTIKRNGLDLSYYFYYFNYAISSLHREMQWFFYPSLRHDIGGKLIEPGCASFFLIKLAKQNILHYCSNVLLL
jgi:hypothetical protein